MAMGLLLGLLLNERSHPIYVAALCGWVAYMVVDCLRFGAEEWSAEKFPYKCRHCGKRGGTEDFLPVCPDCINKAVCGP